MAWLAAPAGLFFVLFFLLPFGVMALFSALTGNPLQRAGVGFTARHYARILDDSLYIEFARFDLEDRRRDDGGGATPRVSAGALAGADALARRPRAPPHGGDRADADRHRRAHLRLDHDPVRQGRHQRDADGGGRHRDAAAADVQRARHGDRARAHLRAVHGADARRRHRPHRRAARGGGDEPRRESAPRLPRGDAAVEPAGNSSPARSSSSRWRSLPM